MLHTDTLAESYSAQERNKKISWFTSVGADQSSDKDLLNLVNIRDEDRLQSEKLRADEDSNRRVGVAHQHMAPCDPSFRTAYQQKTPSSPLTAHNNNTDLLTTYPPPPKSSFDPLNPEASAFKWSPTPSDFFPNTKTMIESRKGALQQFRQLCYYTLLRKRVESRLETLQRERGGLVNQQKSKNNKKNEDQQQQQTATVFSSHSSNKFIILSDIYDPLPNPSAAAPFCLSRELKTQVERKLLEESAKLEGRENQSNLFSASIMGTSVNNDNTRGGKRAGADGKRSGSNNAPRSHSTESKGNNNNKSSAKDGKDKKAATGSKTSGSSGHEEDGNANNKNQGANGNDDGKSSRTAIFAVSSNLQLLQPLRIGDLEIHPEIKMREPFDFRSQRFPRLPFPKHDYVVAGPKNAPLNFPAGLNEISEAPLPNPAQVVLSHLAPDLVVPVSTLTNSNQITPGASGANTARGAARSASKDAALRGPPNTSRPSSASAAFHNNNNNKSRQIQQQQNVPLNLVLPRVSIETFETPSVVATLKMRSALALPNGVSVLSGVTDFPPQHYTRVATAPLKAARPSPVPPRHQQLRVSTMKFCFSGLPKTMTEASADDQLSDDEDHELVGMDDDDDGEEALENLVHQGETNERSIIAARNAGKDDIEQKLSSATYLTAPPLNLDDALKFMNLLSSNTNNKQNNNTSNIASPTSPATAQKRPNTPSKNKPGSAQQQEERPTNSSPTQQQQQQFRSSDDRLSWTSQPVHSEDAFEINENVDEALKQSKQAAEKRRQMIPPFLQHQV